MPLAHYVNSCRLAMSMGNYLRGKTVGLGVMAASNQSVGVDHPTIVPTNFEPELDADSGADDTGDKE